MTPEQMELTPLRVENARLKMEHGILKNPLRPYCAICNKPLCADNDSKEHVITEAIGGRLKVSGFICKICNTVAGRTWDAKLASQLLPL